MNFIQNCQSASTTSIQCSNLLKSPKAVTVQIAKILDSNPNRVKLLISNLSQTNKLLFCLSKLASPIPTNEVCLSLAPNESKFIEEGQYTAAGLFLFAGGFTGNILVWEWIR